MKTTGGHATYLEIAYFGQVPDEISPEDEAEISAEFRKGRTR